MKRSPYAGLYNILTMLVLGLTLLFCMCAGATFLNPQVFFNPLKPNNDCPPCCRPCQVRSANRQPSHLSDVAACLDGHIRRVLSARQAAQTALPASATNQPAATSSATPTATRTPFPTAVGPTPTTTPV